MEYNIMTDLKYGPLELIDVGMLKDSRLDKWWNQSLCMVNDCVARLIVVEGEFHWHKHDAEDELFFVLEGELLVDLEGRSVALKPRQGMMVPRGTAHRTRAEQRTVALAFSAAGVVPTGD